VWVVASNKGGLAEDLRPGFNGDVFLPDRPDELTAILQRIDREPAKYQQQCVEAAHHIRGIDEQVKELENWYETILSKEKTEQTVFA
jgi:hypothetical protein